MVAYILIALVSLPLCWVVWQMFRDDGQRFKKNEDQK
jgi:hypothetical protein